MLMKQCTKCEEYKNEIDFAWKNKAKNKLNSWCKSCQSDYAQEHYKLNTQYYRDKAKISNEAQIAKNKAYMNAKKNVPCTDCGNHYPLYVMDFDHLNSKEFNISHGLTLGHERLKREIDKCEVVCSNCHRIRTHERRNNAGVVELGIHN